MKETEWRQNERTAEAALYNFERRIKPEDTVLNPNDERVLAWATDIAQGGMADEVLESIKFALRHPPEYTVAQLPDAVRRSTHLTLMASVLGNHR